MREIVEVGLKDFQSHKDTVVNFQSGFNVIVGGSDSGKTAIKRGMEAVLYNRYVGAEYIREGAKSFSNYVLFNDGLKIIREKSGRGLNKYIINYPNGEVLELNNFGTKVPQEVLDAHEMYLVELGKELDSLNCAYQLSGPFFLQNTAGERASIIGSIAKTQVIDEAVSDTMSQHREHRKELKSLQSTNKSLEKSIDNYSVWIDEAKDILDGIEDSYEKLNKSIMSFDRVSSVIKSLENNELKAAMQRNIIESYGDIEVLSDKFTSILDKFNQFKMLNTKYESMESNCLRKVQLEETVTKLDGLDNVSEHIDNIANMVSKFNGISNKLKNMESDIKKKESLENIINSYIGTDDLIKEIDLLADDIKKYNELSKKVDTFNALDSRRIKGEGVVLNLTKSLNTSLDKYQKGLKELGKCPVCFSVITDEQFNNIKQNLT